MREALKLALEALEVDAYVYNGEKSWKAITAIKEALREHAMYEVQRLGQEIQPEQEPVAWMRDDEMKAMVSDEKRAWILCGRSELIEEYNKPLYTTPPQRKPLTDEELRAIENKINPNMRWRSSDEEGITFYPSEYYELIQAIEAAHGIKE